MAEEEIILKVSLDGAQEELNNLTLLQDAINQLAQEKKELNAQQKDLTEAIKEGTISDAEAEQASLDLAESQVQLSLETKETALEFRAAEKAVIGNAKANNLAAGSVAQLAAQHTIDKDALRLLSKEERENTEAGRELTEKVKDQSDELKEIEKSYGTTSRSVGDYGVAMEGALPLMGNFGKQIQGVAAQLGQIKTSIMGFTGAQKASTAATTGSSKALKLFRVALIATGIGAFVVILGSLIAAFLSTQRGIDAVSRVLAPLKELFQTFIGFVQDQAVAALDGLKTALDNPKQAFIDLGEAIKNNFVNRFKGALGVVKSVAKLFVGTFKLFGLQLKEALSDVPLIGRTIDTDKLKLEMDAAKKIVLDAGKELADQSLQTVTGVENAAEKLAGLYGDAAEAAQVAIDRGKEMHALTVAIEESEIGLNLQREKSRALIEEQRTITQDVSKTDAERLVAVKLATAEVEKIKQVEEAHLDLKIKLLKKQQEANDTDREGQKELQDLLAERVKIEADAIKQNTRLSSAAFTIKDQQQNKAIADAKKAAAAVEKAEKDAKKASDKDAKDKLDAEKKLVDLKIKNLQAVRALEVATTEETNEEKYQSEVELLDAVGALRLEKARLNGEDLNIVELENQIAAAELKKEEQERIDAEELEAQQLKEETKSAFISAGIDAVDTFQQEIFNNQNRRIDEGLSREVDALNLKREAGEISEEEFNKKRLELDKKAFADRKRLSQAQNLIDFAVATGKTLATYGFTPAAGVAIGLLAIQKATQAAVIASQKFAHGGLINGPSHANGGVNVRVGGSGMIEAEGGEAIINKRSTSKHLGLLSAINQDGGGVALARRGMVTPNSSALARFGNGGVATANAAQSIDLNGIENSIASAVANSFGSIKVQNVASETTDVANRVQQIEDSASF